MDNDNGISNPSDAPSFEQVLEARLSRRQILLGGTVAAAAALLGGAGTVMAQGQGRGRGGRALLDFTAVPPSAAVGPEPAIAAEYEFSAFLPWGDPLEPGGPAFSYPPNAADQALQIGIGHDGMWYFPLEDRPVGDRDRDERGRMHGRPFKGNSRGMLCINHEFGSNGHVLGKAAPSSLADVRVSQHAHGVSVIEIARNHRGWRSVPSARARRIHGNSPVAFSGPAAGHALLTTANGNVPLGTLNNCANGYTPWGTYLTCEENFNGYFGARGPWTANALQQRYGFSANGFGYGWHQFDRRFDLSDVEYANEENRFGWVVEIDPMNATAIPVKRTALGRMKHEGATVVVGRGGRAVVYMGDDERFEYIYKFVSADNWKSMRARGESPLDRGTLYAARFDADGRGQWLELSRANGTLASAFADDGELLINARRAADLVGATRMDRPEWIAAAPDGHLYCTLTNNTQRATPDAANPLAPNPLGHIVRWRDAADHIGTSFVWDIYLLARDTVGSDAAFGSPDGLWADDDGRLFIQTDGSQPGGLNDQMLVADPATGDLRRLFSGVTGCEVTGIAVTPDRRTMFANLQHPGDGDPAQTSFPLPFDGVSIPRDATVVITRKDGGVIGS